MPTRPPLLLVLVPQLLPSFSERWLAHQLSCSALPQHCPHTGCFCPLPMLPNQVFLLQACKL